MISDLKTRYKRMLTGSRSGGPLCVLDVVVARPKVRRGLGIEVLSGFRASFGTSILTTVNCRVQF